MDKDNQKKKYDFMKSIMSNPKLSKTFKEGMAAPIGSTKREQARSTLSIMKKLGGINDGQGGPYDGGMNGMTPTGILGNATATPDYSNMLIFPAAPALKMTLPPDNQSDGSEFNTIGSGQQNKDNNTFTGIPNYSNNGINMSSYQLPTTPTKINTGLTNNGQTYNVSAPSSPTVNNNSSTPLPGFNATGASVTPDSIKALQTQLNQQNAGKPGWVPLKVDGIAGPKTIAAQTFGMYNSNTQNNNGTNNNTSNNGYTPLTGNNGTNNNNTNNNNTNNNGSVPGYVPLAAVNIARILNVSPTTPLSQIPVADIVRAIPVNEGYTTGESKAAIANNNPGNLKFAGQAGAVQGSAAADGGYFAKFQTPEAGKQALQNDINAKYNSGKYQTLADLMAVYSPDSGSSSNGNTGGNSDNTGSNNGLNTGADYISAAQSAVNSNTGPATFAYAMANDKFGGSLDQYVANLDDQLKTQFNLGPLEQQLNDLKNEKGNLVPTLTQYIQGKDQYLKFIDSMIDSTQGDLLNVDMSDPASVDRYNNYTNYLYTLKGRQTQRYGNYLNSAISDYNADVDNMQTNYNTVYQQYTDAMNQKGTMAQNEYNTLLTTMSDLYTSLDGAPVKQANLEALNLQNQQNAFTAAQNGFTGGAVTNPDFLKDVKTYSDYLNQGNKDGSIDPSVLGSGGLAGFFNSISYQGGDPQAAAQAVNIAMAKSLAASNNSMTTLNDQLKMISDLAGTDNGAQLASMIIPAFTKTAQPALASYITSNLASLKNAANDLVKDHGGFLGMGKSNSGLTDKVSWQKKYSNIDQGILESLYTYVTKNTSTGLSSTDLVNQLFSNTPSGIATSLMTSY